MSIKFYEEGHIYKDGKYEFISVTTLLKKHSLAPNFSNVKLDTLTKAREKGKAIHKEVEEYLKNGTLPIANEEATGICEELQLIKNAKIESEVITSTPLDYRVLVAGTIDLKVTDKKTKAVSLYDIKTSKTMTNETKSYTAWQLSLYSFIERLREPKLKINHLYIIYFKSDRNKAIIEELAPISDDKINELLNCEELETIYNAEVDKDTLPVTLLDNNGISVLKEINNFQKEIKAREEKIEALKESLYSYMTSNNINQISSYDKSIMISRVAPSQRESLDTKKIKEEQPGIYDLYKKVSNSKGYVKFTFKEN